MPDVSAVAIPVGVGTLLLSSAVFGGAIGSISDATRTTLTPARGAFGIWGFIFAGLVVLSVAQTYVPVPLVTRALLAVSLVLAAAWTPVFVQSHFNAAAALLVLSSIAALSATFVRATQRVVPLRERLLVDAPLGLYAGWLAVAALLSIGIATKSAPMWTRTVLVVGLSGAAVANPALVIGPSVALAFSTDVHPLLWVSLFVGALVGVLRGYFHVV